MIKPSQIHFFNIEWKIIFQYSVSIKLKFLSNRVFRLEPYSVRSGNIVKIRVIKHCPFWTNLACAT